MSWTTLGNGVCPPPPPEGLRFVAVSSGYYVNMAIDNAGRLYAWGSSSYQYQGQTPVAVPATTNFLRNPATYRVSPHYEAMVYPYQTGYPKSNWVDCQTYEYVHMALDADGYIYAVGSDGASGGTVYGLGGWGPTNQYNDISDVFYLGGSQAITFQLVNDQQWESFRLGGYHVLAQKADKSLWIWGTNTDNRTYGSLAYPDDYMSLTPILMNWLPASPVKLFDANNSVNVIVTESNQIYGWGSWWMDTAYGPTPTLIPLSLPSGVTISDVKCCQAGIVVLLSNGEVYGIGYDVGFDADQAMVFTLAPGGHNFTKLFASIENGAAALDANGVLWAWGNQSFLIVQGGATDFASINPMFTGSADAYAHKWVNFAAGSWSYLAIDDEGRLWSWGTPVYGLQGIGLFEDNPAATELYAAVECGPFATLDNGLYAYVESPIASSSVSVSQIRIPRDLYSHNPCGHWHVKTFEAGSALGDLSVTAPFNCWNVTPGAVDGFNALVVLNGTFGPNEMIFLLYNIQSNTWKACYETAGVTTNYYDTGAAICGDVRAFHAFGYDTVGARYQETATNPCLRTYIQHGTSMQLKKWPTGPGFNAINKVAVNATGLVALIVVDSLNIRVEVSTNYGATYVTSQSFPKTTFSDAGIVIDNLDDMYIAALNYSGSTMLVYRSVNDGASWTLQSTTPVVTNPTTINFRNDGTKYVATVGGASEARFYYSIPGCTVFTARNLQSPSMLFAATDTSFYNLADGTDYFTSNYEATSPIWKPIIEDYLNPTIITRGTLNNSGMNTVYTHPHLRDETVNGPYLAILVSTDLGQVWHLVRTPFNWCTTFQDVLEQFETPVWPFVHQAEKIGV